MIQELINKNIFIYLMAGLCLLGIIIKIMVGIIYKDLIKESDNMASSENKLMKLMKLKFETCYKLKIGVNNVDAFVDKYVYKYKLCGVFLYTWENISGQLLMICMLTGTVSSVLALLKDCGRTVILSTFFMGVITSSLLIMCENLINLQAKRKVIQVNIRDYLDNFLKVRLEREYLNPELLEEYRNEYFSLETEEKDRHKEESKRADEIKKVEEEKRAELMKKDFWSKRTEENNKMIENSPDQEKEGAEEHNKMKEKKQSRNYNFPETVGNNQKKKECIESENRLLLKETVTTINNELVLEPEKENESKIQIFKDIKRLQKRGNDNRRKSNVKNNIKNEDNYIEEVNVEKINVEKNISKKDKEEINRLLNNLIAEALNSKVSNLNEIEELQRTSVLEEESKGLVAVTNDDSDYGESVKNSKKNTSNKKVVKESEIRKNEDKIIEDILREYLA